MALLFLCVRIVGVYSVRIVMGRALYVVDLRGGQAAGTFSRIPYFLARFVTSMALDRAAGGLVISFCFRLTSNSGLSFVALGGTHIQRFNSVADRAEGTRHFGPSWQKK